MRLNVNLPLLLCIITVATHGQEVRSPSLDIGDPAPPLRLREWIKGSPVQQLEKNKVYVVEFWATWCAPCRSTMPHFSALARKYGDKITFLSIDVMERKTTPLEKVKAFVDSMGDKMDYPVAVENSYLMESGWLNPAQTGIPSAFVVNAEGIIAWIGHPMRLEGEEVLPKIINNTWDVKATLAKRNRERRLKNLDMDVPYELIRFRDPLHPEDLRHPDSVLLAINEIVKKEPDLKYAPVIAYYTFVSLLKTDPRKAYEYGKMAIVTPTYEEPAWSAIRVAVRTYADTLKLPPEICELGAEAYQAEIDHIGFPENVDLYKYYNNMAALYWRANQPLKAIDAQQKAIADMKKRKRYSGATLAEYESKLRQYESK